MPDPTVLAPGESSKIISQPPMGSEWQVDVDEDGADVYLSHNPRGTVREGRQVTAGDRANVSRLQGRSFYAKNPPENTKNAEVEVSKAHALIEYNSPTVQVNNTSRQSAEGIDHTLKTVTGIAGGDINRATIIPPSETVWELQQVTLYAPPISGATTGQHNIVFMVGDGELSLLKGEDTYDSNVWYKYGEWQNPSVTELPSDAGNQLDVVRGVRVDADNPIYIDYGNSSDASQDQDVNYNIHYRTIDV